MTFKHIFPKIENFFFCIPLRIGLIVSTFLVLAGNILNIYNEHERTRSIPYFDCFSMIITILFFICLFKPIRFILYYYRYLIVISFLWLVIVAIMLIYFFISEGAKGFSVAIALVVPLIIYAFVVYYYICCGSYAEKAIEKIDDEDEARALEEKYKF